MKTKLTLILVALIFCAEASRPLLAAVPQTKTQAVSKQVRRYACPMHPDVTSARRGRCPRCGMRLRLTKQESPSAINEATRELAASPVASQTIPDLPVIDQNGKRLRFYSDLVAGRVVAINFIFTTCTTICPPLTATFRRVQQDLATSAPEAKLISISVDPGTDTPERLYDFAAKFRAGPGWTFVTGEKSDIDALLRAFGVYFSDKNDHTPIVLIGNDETGQWTRIYGLSPPSTIAQAILNAEKK